ncbi:hypothetical protein GCM10020229_63460 [Kitasatospora albolonga]
MAAEKRAKAVLVAAASAALATAVVGGTATASASAPAPETALATATAGAKPTIVLVHGAFADASSWSGVIKRLQADGYPVVAPAVPLRGPASDAAALRGVIRHIPGPKVLVGHSYGGSVISAAGAGDPDVKALVYVAAFLPEAGETALGLSGKYPGSTLGPTLDPVTYTLPDGSTTTDLSIRPDAFHHQFAARRPGRPGRVDGRDPAADRRGGPEGAGHRGRLEGEAELGRGHHRGPEHPARRPAVHGGPGPRPGHRGGRLALRRRLPPGHRGAVVAEAARTTRSAN